MSEVDDLIDMLYASSSQAEKARYELAKHKEAAVEPLIALLEGKHPIPNAKPSMGLFGQVIFTVRSIMNTEEVATTARCRAIWTLARIKGTRAVEALINSMQTDSAETVRLTCIHHLGKLSDPLAIEPLVAILDDPAQENLHSAAAYSLIQLGDSRAVPAFIHLIETAEMHAKPRLIPMLAETHDPRAVEPLIRLLRIPGFQWNVSAEAAKGLAKIGDPRAIEPLIEVLNRPTTHGSTTEACLEALTVFGGRRAAEGILQWIRPLLQLPEGRWSDAEENYGESDWGSPFHVLRFLWSIGIESLGKTGDTEAIAELNKLLEAAPAYIPRR